MSVRDPRSHRRSQSRGPLAPGGQRLLSAQVALALLGWSQGLRLRPKNTCGWLLNTMGAARLTEGAHQEDMIQWMIHFSLHVGHNGLKGL